MRRKIKTHFIYTLILTLACLSLSKSANAQRLENSLWAVAAGPKYTAVGGNFDSLFLYANEIPRLDVSLPISGTITNLKWHPTEDLLAISIQSSTVGLLILDLRTMKLDTLGVAIHGARALGWSPSGERLAVGDNEGDLYIFDQRLDLLKTVDTGLRSITGLDWHPQKNLITMVSGKIGEYDLDTDQMRTWESRKEEVLMLSIAWHPSGAFFATGDYGDYIEKYPALLQFWNEDGSLIRSVEGSKAEYRNIRWTPDGTHLATASEAFRLWGTSGNLVTALPFDHLLWGLSFDKKHNQWLATDNTGQVFMISKDGTQRVTKVSPFHRRQ